MLKKQGKNYWKVKEKTIEYYYRNNGYDSLLQVKREKITRVEVLKLSLMEQMLFNTPHPYFLD